MLLNLPGLIYGVALILTASLELQTRNARPLTAMLSVGLTRMEPLWQAVEALVSRLNPFEHPAFDRRNLVHRVAGLFLIAQTCWAIWHAFSIRADTGISFFAPDISGLLSSMAAMVLIYVSLSALGTGWRLRRDQREVLQRLGLRRPTFQDCLAGLCFGCLLFFGMTVATFIALSVTSADQIGTPMGGSRQLFEVVKGSLPAALLVAILAGIGEEILFRGALQPVFGLFVSSLFFAIVHVQYGLSTATLILFFVSLGMGLVRKRYSTTAAIITHATYNFMPFVLYRLLPA